MLKARIFRFFALFFAVIGFGVFMILYLRNIDGQWVAALTEPRTLWMILLPFLPAALLSYIAERTREEFLKIARSHQKKGEE